MIDKQTSTKILVVDDEPNISIAIEFLMRQQGFHTETAYHGQEALAKAMAFEPDLIILDVMMPVIDGYGVARAIREQQTEHVPQIIFLTAKGTSRDKMQGYGSGGDVYLTKPFDNQELVDTVLEMIEFERS
jgi:DNA-binding response OmpR family regulator